MIGKKKPTKIIKKEKKKTKVQIAQDWIDKSSIPTKEEYDKSKMPSVSEEYVGDKLNPKQELFCELYVSSNKEMFGNGVQCYIEVYDPDTTQKNWYKTACSAASRLLSNVKVCNRINELLESSGLNDQFADKQLLFLMTQHSDHTNKLGALKEYNKLKGRITEKIEQKTEIDITGFSDDEKKKLLALLK